MHVTSATDRLMRYRACWMLLGAILAITGLTSAQSSAPVSRATFFYEVTNQGDYSWNVAPAAPWPSSLLVQFASSETKQEHGTSYAIGEITEFNEYLWTCPQ